MLIKVLTPKRDVQTRSKGSKLDTFRLRKAVGKNLFLNSVEEQKGRLGRYYVVNANTI